MFLCYKFKKQVSKVSERIRKIRSKNKYDYEKSVK